LYNLDSMIPWVNKITVLPFPHNVAPTVKSLRTGFGVVPAIESGFEGMPLSRAERLNDKDTTSQLFSIVVLIMNYGAETEIGTQTSLQDPFGRDQPHVASTRATRKKGRYIVAI
jgi:hypothetical protein